MTASLAYFDTLYQSTDDPWGFRSRWYEQRKQAILLACLDRREYGRAFEPACANGELAAALAPRCGTLLASDFHPPALAIASQRLAGFRNVELELRTLPGEWPEGQFDLIVLGEVGYYLGESALREVVTRSMAALTATGTLVACHWRHRIADAPLTGDEVHTIIRSVVARPAMTCHREQDFVAEVWSLDARSVAAREGLK